jgi:rubrerythrin
MEIECSKCGYSFSKDKVPEICPYCGEKGTLRRKKTAQDYLNEADDF